jgi:ABC-type sulfate transport system substrate-binding protein
MEKLKTNKTNLLKEALKKQINASLNEQTITINGTSVNVFLVKKGSPSEEKHSDLIIDEIELKEEIFFMCR